MAEKKKAGFLRKLIDKGRKKIAPTFDEQFDKALYQNLNQMRISSELRRFSKKVSTLTKGEGASIVAEVLISLSDT